MESVYDMLSRIRILVQICYVVGIGGSQAGRKGAIYLFRKKKRIIKHPAAVAVL
jgi:hypothetical protein